MMDKLFALSTLVGDALAALTKLALGLIVVLVVIDVGMRNFARPIAWSTSATEYLLIAVAFLPAPYLVRAKGHVCADFIRQALPLGAQRLLEKAVYALCILLCLYLGWLAAVSMVESWRSGAYDVRSFDFPKWAIFLPMALGLWLSAVEFLRYLLGYDSIYALNVHEIEGF